MKKLLLTISLWLTVGLAGVWAQTLQITARANNTEYGSVNGIDDRLYDEGEEITLTVIPNTGYEFVNWTIDEVEVSQRTTYTFIAEEDVELVANFVLTEIVTRWPIGSPPNPEAITATISASGILTITGSGAMRDFPGTPPWQTATKRIVIGNGVTSIGSSAFRGCSSLTEVSIPEGVTSIGSSAFYGCSNLTEVTIPEGVTSIGSYAFYGCSSLTEVSIPEGVTSIGSSAFYGCSKLTEVIIPSSVTSIPDASYSNYGVFGNCSSLTKVTIPEGVTSIGSSAFYGCSSLTEVTIPEGVTSIGSRAFYGCSKLTEVTIPSRVTSIGSEAFYGCTALSTVTNKSFVPQPISTNVFSQSTYNNATLYVSNLVYDAYIASNWFYFYNIQRFEAVGVNGVQLNKTTATLNVGNTEQLIATIEPADATHKHVTWSSSNTDVATVNSSGLITASRYTVGTAIITATTVQGGFTATCEVTVLRPVTGISLPETLDINIGSENRLTATIQPYNATNQEIIWSSSNEDVATVNSSGYIQSISAGTTTITVTTVDGDFTATCEVTVIAQWNCGYPNETDVTAMFDNGTLTISGIGAMKDYYYYNTAPWHNVTINKIIMEEGVTSIGSEAFSNCHVTEVTISESVTSIEQYAFRGCNNLIQIACQNPIPPTVGYNAFEEIHKTACEIILPAGSECDYKEAAQWKDFAGISCLQVWYCGYPNETDVTATFDNGTLTISGIGAMKDYGYYYNGTAPWRNVTINKIIMEEGVTSIGREAFRNCSGSIIIPTSVISIGNNAFYYSNLTDLTIPESVTNIGDEAFTGCSDLTRIRVSEQNKYYSSEAGVLFNKDKTELILCPAAGKTGTYIIPNSVTKIGNDAFFLCSGLTEIIIPESVTSIGYSVFFGCRGLTEITVSNENANYLSENGILFNKNKTVLLQYPAARTGIYTIPNSVAGIRENAFYYCTGLTKITIPNSVTSIDYNAFRGCRGLTEITIPNGVAVIGFMAFDDCNALTSITNLSHTIQNIEENVFSSDIYDNATLHVPAPSYAAYTNATGWRNFSTIESFAVNPTLQVVVQSDNAEYGSVSIREDRLYESGELVTVTATANSGYMFVHWLENDIEVFKEATYSFVVNNDRTLIAVFEELSAITLADLLNNAEITTVSYSSELSYSDAGTFVTGTSAIVEGDGYLFRYSGDYYFAKAYKLTGMQAGDMAEINVGSSANAYMYIYKKGSSGNIERVYNDDYNGSNSHLVFTAQETTDYYIIATTYGSYINNTNYSIDIEFTLPQAVTGISLLKTLNISVGNGDYLAAIITPNNATNQEIIWESSNAVVSISRNYDNSVYVYGESEGTATITATTADGSFTATCEVTVTVVAVESISLSEETMDIAVGERSYLLADIMPYNATTGEITWSSSNEDIVRIGEVYIGYGQVEVYLYGESEGSATITATTTNGLTVSCEVTVTVVAVEGITLSEETMEISAGYNDYLYATITPYNASNQRVIWSSSNENVVEIDEWYDGDYTSLYGRSVGTATITATTEDGSFTATCEVTVRYIDVEGITLSSETLDMSIGREAYLSATITPDNATNQKILWSSSNEDVVAIDEWYNGGDYMYVSGVSEGTATITATTEDGSFTASCEVTVRYIDVESITLNRETVDMIAGYSTPFLSATITPGNATNQEITWSSSNEDVAIARSNNGYDCRIIGLSAGTAIITATTANGVSASCEVTVTYIDIEEFTLSAETLDISVGHSDYLYATITPGNASNQQITWSSSNENVVRISGNGDYVDVYGESAGTATITATTANGLIATCEVTVTYVDVTSVSLPKTMNIVVGYQDYYGGPPGYPIYVTVRPNNASNQEITWSNSNEDVAIIGYQDYYSREMYIQGLSAGTTTITATTANGLTATCEVTVSVIDVSGISLPATMDIIAGEYNETRLSATIMPNNASNTEIIWSSSNEDVAIYEYGYVRGLSAGTATITATTVDGGFTASCEVTVTVRDVTGISLSNETLNINVGYDSQLRATITPYNASNQEITWSSSNEDVVAIDEWYNGGDYMYVSGVSAGTATITATTANGLTATCEVTVTYVDVTGISLNKETAEVLIGKELSTWVEAAIIPYNASNKEMIWSSSNENVAIVTLELKDDYSGLQYVSITGVSAGTATITVTSADGGFSASCEVTVSDDYVVIMEHSLTDEWWEEIYSAGEECTVRATEPAGYRFVHWEQWIFTDEAMENYTATVVSHDMEYTFTVQASDKHYVYLVPVFETAAGYYEVSVSASNGGYAYIYRINNSYPSTQITSEAFTNGTSNVIVAYAPHSYNDMYFIGWEENGEIVSEELYYEFTATGSRALKAVFKTFYQIDLTARGGGSVSGGGMLAEGSECVATATANEGYVFVNWLEDEVEVSTEAVYSFTVSKNRTLTAVFEELPEIVDNETAVANAKIIIESNSYVIAQAVANSEADVKAELLTKINTLIASTGVTVQNITIHDFTAAAEGVNGSFNFTVSLSKEEASATTAGKTGTITASAFNPHIPVNSVEIDKTAVTLAIGETERLTATVYPSNASNQAVTWMSTNPAVAIVSNSGQITALSAGTAVIIVTSDDSNETATCNVTVLPQTGIEDVTNANLVVYPNPTKGQLTISGDIWESQPIEIYDNTGRIVGVEYFRPDNTINISHLPNGIYFVHINGTRVKVVKQ